MMANARPSLVTNGPHANEAAAGHWLDSPRQQLHRKRRWLMTLLVMACSGCSGSGSAPLSPAPTTMRVKFWEDPSLTISCHITGSDQSIQDHVGLVTVTQPAKPAGVPAGFKYHWVDVDVTQGLSYYMTVNRDGNPGAEWDYEWNQDADSVQAVDWGSSRF